MVIGQKLWEFVSNEYPEWICGYDLKVEYTYID